MPPRPDLFFLAFFALQTLLIDGYISQTFHSQAAEQYFLDLLRNASIPPHTILSYTRREYGFFVRSVPPHIPARFSNPPGHWLLDHSIVSNGTVVPQTMWSPAGTGRRQNVEGAELQMPIFFENKDGGLGLSLEASIDRRCHVLRHAIHPAPLGQRTTTHIRIVWPGYKNYKRQIPTRDESRAHKPITMARFVRLVGRAVNNFLQARLPT
ncbi:hypothetical protein EDB84DRAFT_1265376 [Lactarius hengduanensis]|nr:hypothetical protein EDB84DRAFT_1265376 [Lactarius hengduanensis]